jgi:branched-chain amino acid transport system permease protein
MLKEIGSRMASVNLQHRVIALFAIVLMIIPLGAGPYPVTVMVEVGLYSIVTMGIILLMGFAGQISVGHAVFFGTGAYTSAILTTQYQLSPWLGIFLGAVISGGVAVLFGRAMFRLHGLILAGITLAANLVFYYLVSSLIGITGGAMGMMNIPPLILGGFNFSQSFYTYYMIWIIAILLLVFSLNLANSQTGRTLRSMNIHAGGSEDAAQVLGINVMKYKVQVFALSAVYASIAGSIYAHYARVIEPGTFFIPFSVMVLIMAVLGGLRSPWGAFLGAGLMIGVRELLREVVPIFVAGVTGAYELIAYGVILIIVLLFLPRGLVSIFGKVLSKEEGSS